jgi:hypothetical protein
LSRLLLAVALLLAVPASAQAAFDVPSYTVRPTSLQAGSHPDVSVGLQFGGDEHVKDLTIGLPPGLVGNPNATARCSASAFAADACPEASQIGTTSVVSRIALLPVSPVTAEGTVYNLVPGAGEPARLGVVVRPPLGADKVFIVSRVALRASDGGLDSIITGLPSTVGLPLLGPSDMRIESMNLTLEGRPAGAKQPFMTMPTSCRAAIARVTARSDAGTNASRAAPPFTPTACNRLPFKPALQASLTNDRRPALRTVITGPPGNANTAAASVTLPAGLAVNTQALQHTCTLAQQAAGPCPAAAHVGRARVESPLLPPLTGPVSLAQLQGRVLPGLRVDLTGVVSLSLTAVVDGNPLTTRLGGLPDVPLERFELTFDPDGSLSASKDFCRGRLPRIAARLTGQNGVVADLREPVTVTGCRKPVASLRVHGRRLRLHVKAARGGPALERVRLKLPKRLKVHPRRGRVSHDAKLTRRALKVRAGGARTVTVRLSRGAFTGKLGKKRKLTLVTRDVSGRTVRQRVRARR